MKTKLIRSLTLVAAIGLSFNFASAADKQSPQKQAGTKDQVIKQQVEKTAANFRATLEKQTEIALRDAHKEIFGLHSLALWENLGDRKDGKATIITDLDGKHRYVAYAPEMLIPSIVGVKYTWVDHAGLLVQMIGKDKKPISGASYFDFQIDGSDPATIAKHLQASTGQ
jgi:hypothetical protein